MNFPNLQLTQKGIEAILAGVYGGSTITFTGAKIGSGTAPANIREATDLTTETAELSLTDYDVSDGIATLEFVFDNSDLDTGFYFRELGIFAQVDEEEPIMYAYSNTGETAGYIKPYDSDSYLHLSFEVHVTVGDAENVEALIDGAVGYVTVSQFNEHLADYSNPHHVTKEQVGLGNVPNETPSNMAVTFTKPATLVPPSSGDTLETITGAVAKAVEQLKSHLQDGNNPHEITPELIGASPTGHKHSASDITSGTLSIARGGTGGNTAAAARASLGAASVQDFSVIVPATGWTGASAPYTRSVNVSGILAEDKPIIDLVQTGTWATDENLREAWGCITRITTAANKLNLTAEEVPSVDFTIQVRCVR